MYDFLEAGCVLTQPFWHSGKMRFWLVRRDAPYETRIKSHCKKSVVVDRDHFSHVGDSDDEEALEASGFVDAAEEGVAGGF